MRWCWGFGSDRGTGAEPFFNELEEWLASLTRISSGIIDGETPIPVFVQLLLEQTAENMESLQRMLSRGEESRIQANQAIIALSERIAAISDDRSAEHLRSIDATLQRLAVELNAAQAQSATDLRQDLRLLTRTLAARAEERAP